MITNLAPGIDPSARQVLERRAASLLGVIEARCAYMWRESQRAIQTYFLAESGDRPRRLRGGSLSDLKPEASANLPTIDDLERYTQYWQGLLPADLDLQAVFAHLLVEKYPFARATQPRIAAVLCLDDEALQARYARLYGMSVNSLFTVEPQPPGPVAETLDPQEAALREAAAALDWIVVPGGGTLYCAGDEDDALYALVSGRLRVAVATAAAGAEQAVAELGRGALVGLTEVISGAARADTVYAIRDSEVVRLSSEHLHRLAEKYPQLWAGLSAILANRLRTLLEGPRHIPNTLATFALVPADPGMPLEEFSRRFVAALAVYGSTLAIDSALVGDRLSKGTAQAQRGDLDHSRLVAWLTKQEVDNRYVVYLADQERSAWSDSCVREADRVLIVAEAAGNPEVLGACLHHIRQADPKACVELVLLQAADCVLPVGTSRWLTGHAIEKHQHVRVNSDGDVQRFVRRLTGHALGLVLGGGGARGWAHLGVSQALAEAGIEVDLLGGTSMGALIGGMLAAGLDEAAIRNLAREFSAPAKLFDPTLPIVSFFSTAKVSAMLQQVFGDTQIEDLWRPFFCVASNVSRAAEVVMTTGPLWEAVRASMSIPGIFSPMLRDGDVLVDGAVLNNLPIDVMERFSGGGPIVAVNVFPDVDIVKEYQFDPSISGWEVLLKQLNPLTGSMQVPWLFENLVRILSLNDVQQARAKRNLADVYIRPPVERFNILGFGSYEEIIEIGYETARPQFEQWLRTPDRVQVPGEPLTGPTQAAHEAEGPTVSGLLGDALTDLEDVLKEA